MKNKNIGSIWQLRIPPPVTSEEIFVQSSNWLQSRREFGGVNMDMKFTEPIKLAQELYPQPPGKIAKYGTAGLRQK